MWYAASLTPLWRELKSAEMLDAPTSAIGVSVAFTIEDRAGGCRRIAGGGSASEVEVAAPFEEDLEGGRHDRGAPRAVGGHLERGAGVGLRRGNEERLYRQAFTA